MRLVIDLIQSYKGKSVTVQDCRPGGKLFFVDVLESGEIRNSYGNHEAIDLVMVLQPKQ